MVDAGSVLDVVRRLTAAAPSWTVWKNADAAVAGVGDVDAVASTDEWPVLAAEHRRWAVDTGAEATFECRHQPGVLLLVAVDAHSPRLSQLDISSHVFVHGAPLVDARALGPAVLNDPRGFRRLRPGAEALLRVAQSAGNEGAVDAELRELLATDLIGRETAGALMGRAGAAALSVAADILDGGRSRRAEAQLRGWCLWTAARRPLLPARRVYAGLLAMRSCPLIAALRAGRRVPESREAWLDGVARSHRRWSAV